VRATADQSFRLSCLALLLLLSSFALAPLHIRRVAYSLVAVLDITGSMNTRDQVFEGASISRLEMEKHALLDVLGSLPCGSELSVAIFVEERPFLLFAPMEVCENFAPLAQSIAAIDWRMGWDSESHIAAALLNAMVLARGQDANLLFMTDGQETPPLSWSTPVNFGLQRGAVGGLIVGVGGTELVPIPKYDKTGRLVGVWKPGEVPSETGGMFKGREYLTAVDEPHLRSLSAQTGLAYKHLLSPAHLMQIATSSLVPRQVESVRDLRFVPAGLALLVLALANVKNGRRLRRPAAFTSAGSRR
jgi:mxaL protein